MSIEGVVGGSLTFILVAFVMWGSAGGIVAIVLAACFVIVVVATSNSQHSTERVRSKPSTTSARETASESSSSVAPSALTSLVKQETGVVKAVAPDKTQAATPSATAPTRAELTPIDMASSPNVSDLQDQPNSIPLGRRERQEILNREINRLVLAGCRIESSSDFAFVLTKGRRLNHLLHLILTILTFGIWGLAWIYMGIFGGIKRGEVRVDEFGNLTYLNGTRSSPFDM